MANYRVYYCTGDGKRFGAEDIDATNDAGAIERARQFAAPRVPVVEIWQDDRLVYRGESRERTPS